MSEGLVSAAYIVAALLFILSLAGLAKQETAQKINHAKRILIIILRYRMSFFKEKEKKET